MLNLELSSCESSEYYYVDYFIRISKKDSECETLYLDVDRGVDLDTLTYFLESFPNLTSLHLEQNYSHESTTEDFITMIKTLKLKSLTLVDEQSQFLKGLTIDLLLEATDQTIHITYGDDEQCVSCKNVTMIGDYSS